MSRFHVGQEVVFVDDSGDKNGLDAIPVVGNHYTVREVVNLAGFEEAIRLVELVLPERRYRGIGLCECPWSASRFRPVKREAIEWAREMARKATQPEKKNSLAKLCGSPCAQNDLRGLPHA